MADTEASDDFAARVSAVPLPHVATLGEARDVIAAIVANDRDAISIAGADGDDFGSYGGLPPRTAWLDDGRDMQLLAPLSYTRPDGSVWSVPEGITINGASIPEMFWGTVGGPYEGQHRNASIIHDHYCVTQSRSWQDTHRMFYEAMRSSGVGFATAKIMYYAVYRFGPRWADAVDIASTSDHASIPSDADAQSIARVSLAIADADPPLEAIEALADAQRDRA